MLNKAFLILLLPHLLCSCLKQVPFQSSSADFNGNRIQEMKVKQASVQAVAEKVKASFASFNIQLSQERDCGEVACLLQFEVANKGTEMTTTTTYSNGLKTEEKNTQIHSSVYYAKISKENDGVRVLLLGLPKINAVMSCPDFVPKYLAPCKVENLNAGMNGDLYGGTYDVWKIDISGRIEYVVLKKVIQRYNGQKEKSITPVKDDTMI